MRGRFMIYGLERAFEKAENDAIAVAKLLIAGKNVEEISKAINLSLQEVLQIKEKFESL